MKNTVELLGFMGTFPWLPIFQRFMEKEIADLLECFMN